MNKAKKGTNMANSKITEPNLQTDKVPFDLMAHLGIDASQVEENTSTPRTSKEILDNKDSLQDDAKTSIKSIMGEHGTDVSFTCLKRDGVQKDANGKAILKDGKKVPQFVQTKMSGKWVVDERKEGNTTFYEVSRVHYYTEAFTIAEYKDLS